jgi:predicted Zn-dependent peptidase
MRKYQLNNGLTVIEDPIVDAQSFTILVMFRTGSRNETPGIWGISHFLEHMAFKGTPSYPSPTSLAEEMVSLGADYNAFTSKEHTGYYIKGSKRVLSRAIKLLSEMTISPIILDEEVDKERGTIIEEINMSLDDPARKIYDFFEESLYADRQVSQEIIGSKESLASIHAKQIIDYREKYYLAGNAVIALSGFVPTGFAEMLETAFVDLSTGSTDYLSPTIEPRKQMNIFTKKTEQTHLAIGFPGLNVHDGEKAIAQVLATLLGGNMASRMFSEVREKRGLAYFVRTFNDNLYDVGSLVTFASVNNEKAPEAAKIILDVYESTKIYIPESELRRTKDFLTGIMTLSYENSERRSEINATTVLYGEKPKTLDQKIIEIEAVTIEQILALAKKLFDDKKLCLALIGPYKDETEFARILELNV